MSGGGSINAAIKTGVSEDDTTDKQLENIEEEEKGSLSDIPFLVDNRYCVHSRVEEYLPYCC